MSPTGHDYTEVFQSLVAGFKEKDSEKRKKFMLQATESLDSLLAALKGKNKSLLLGIGGSSDDYKAAKGLKAILIEEEEVTRAIGLENTKL